MLRRAVLEGRPATFRMGAEERELAFHDAQVPLTSPIGARVLLMLYHGGQLRLKKPPQKSLPALEAYIATEPAFRAEVARAVAADDAKRLRLAEIIADPACARPDELSAYLIDKVVSAQHGHGAYGTFQIAGIACHRELSQPDPAEDARLRRHRERDEDGPDVVLLDVFGQVGEPAHEQAAGEVDRLWALLGQVEQRQA